jgi:hypothetical protein
MIDYQSRIAELKAISSELGQLKAMSQTKSQPRRAPLASVERRVTRMLEKLAQGGEVAQGVVRELFPGGIWLSADPDGGRFLWATAQTAMPRLETPVDTDGCRCPRLSPGFTTLWRRQLKTSAEATVVARA